MRDSRPQLLDVLFDDALTADKAPLHNVQQHALALLRLNRAVKSLLPAQLHLWCRVANLRQGILVLEAANASWMMRLRYEQPMLLSTLRAQILPSLTSIDIRINPGLMANGEHRFKNTQQAAPLRRHLSQES
ncbi:MAG: DciA family protein, partial [Serratia symbiotica]|nr:DciA family protein [Serratia symbiotica]